MAKSIKLKAPAKINLSLRILRKLNDGFHEIETLFLAVGLWDYLEIKLQKHKKIFVDVKNSAIANDESNLCFQSAQLFSKHITGFEGCNIVLNKNIPDGAGLGGGSSDAASILLGLNKLFDFPLTMKKLRELSISLGADVPFFLQPGFAIGKGKGEKLEHIKFNWDFWILLLCPSLKISTSWAYSNLKIGLTNDEKNIILKSLDWQGMQLDVFSEFFENDFEPLVFSFYPELNELKQRLCEEGAIFASLSGSGSTIYGIFSTREAAEIAEKKFNSNLKTFVVKPI